MMDWIGRLLMACLLTGSVAVGCGDETTTPDDTIADTAASDADTMGGQDSVAPDTTVDTVALDTAEVEEVDELDLDDCVTLLDEDALWDAPQLDWIPVPLFERHPWVGELNGWQSQVTASDEPTAGELAAFGTGNGHVFALAGLTLPLNTLHGMAGPTYQKRETLFWDMAVDVVEGDDEPFGRFDVERLAWPSTAPLILWQGEKGSVVTTTLDVAPDPPLLDDPGHKVLVRLVTITAEEAPAEPLTLVVRAAVPMETVDGVWTGSLEERSLKLLHPGATGEVLSPTQYAIELGVLPEGGEITVPLVFVMSDLDAEPLDAEALGDLDVDAVIDATGASWASWLDGLVTIDTPDPMVDDFVTAQLFSLKTQQAATGASCPMSHYSRTWLRDNAGPLRAYVAMGALDEAAAMLDYLYGATVLAGDFANSYEADLDVSSLPDPPDWASLPPLEGKTAAENISHLALMYGWYVAASGDVAKAADHFGYLTRSVAAQGVSEDGFLPFSGDETFRTAMNIVFGLQLEVAHHDLSWSLNSAVLFLGAAHTLAYLAEVTGEPYPADPLDGLVASVEATLDGAFWQDGYWSAYIDRATMTPAPGPFEDANLAAIWGGGVAADDPKVLQDIEYLMTTSHPDPGVVQSPPAEQYTNFMGLATQDGVRTGMVSGYTLFDLTETGHPEAGAAFDYLGEEATASAEFGEYLLYGNKAVLQLIYNPIGEPFDYAARFRPWEGGINLHAAVHYLLGWTPDAPHGTVTIAPHLPEGWGGTKAHKLPLGQARCDLSVKRGDAAFYLEVGCSGGEEASATIVVTPPEGTSASSAVTATGDELTVAVDDGGFSPRAVIGPVTLVPDQSVTIKISF